MHFVALFNHSEKISLPLGPCLVLKSLFFLVLSFSLAGWFGEWNFVADRVLMAIGLNGFFLPLISMRTLLNFPFLNELLNPSISYALELSNEKVSIWGLDRIFCLSMQESCACINLHEFLFWWTWFFDWKVRTFAIFVAIIWFYLQSKPRKITSMSEISWTCCAYWYMLTYVRYLLPNFCEVWMGMGELSCQSFIYEFNLYKWSYVFIIYVRVHA